MQTINSVEYTNIPIKELPSGDHLTLDIFTIDSKKPGPTVYIQSSMHGGEHQGSAVIYTLIKELQEREFRGKIIFVPNSNPYALNNKSGQYTNGRFDPTTGENWNRLYLDILSLCSVKESIKKFAKDHHSLETQKIKTLFKELLSELLSKNSIDNHNSSLNTSKKLHLTLQRLAMTSDIVLDLHTGPKAVRYIYSPKSLKEEAKFFHFPYYLFIPEVFHGAMDEATLSPWHFLQEELLKYHIKAPPLFSSYTIELGSEEVISFEMAKDDSSKIINYLNHKGLNIDWKYKFDKPLSYYSDLKDFKTYYSNRGGLYDYNKVPGDHCKKGSTLATFLNFKSIEVNKQKDYFKAPSDCIIINHYGSSSVPEGSQLFQVMENFKEL